MIGTLPDDKENYTKFNDNREETNDFVNVKSPWCLVYVMANNASGKEEPHILSCNRRDQMAHYYIVETAAPEVFMFRCLDLAHLANKSCFHKI